MKGKNLTVIALLIDNTNILKLPIMASEAINKYIEKRYKYWMDYALYHCTRAGIQDEATDVMNEVMAMLLEKGDDFIRGLYDKKDSKYRELDYFVLRMIKLNVQSPTSPYQHKYKPIPADDNVDFQRMDLVDESDEEEDQAERILDMMHQVRTALDGLDLSPKAKAVFSFKFFQGESFTDWPGKESKKELYDIYNGVLQMIRDTINGKILF